MLVKLLLTSGAAPVCIQAYDGEGRVKSEEEDGAQQHGQRHDRGRHRRRVCGRGRYSCLLSTGCEEEHLIRTRNHCLLMHYLFFDELAKTTL